MLSRGTNFPAVGEYNQAVILDGIRRARSGISRRELSQATGLSVQTVSNVTRRLIASGIVFESGTVIEGPGKPRAILELVPESHYAVGVHLDPSLVTCVVLDLNGCVVVHRSHDVGAADSPDALIRDIATLIADVIALANIDVSRVLGVGIASPGPLDVTTGVVIDPPLLKGWDRVPLRQALIELTGLPVLLERDVTAAVVAELWTRVDDAASDFVFFYFGTGINAGIALDRDVVRGVHGRAGGAGHVSTGPGGEPCSCGRVGCLVSTCIPEVVIGRARAAGILRGPHPMNGDRNALLADMSALVGMAEDGNDAAADLFSELGDRMGRAVSTLVEVLDVKRVVVGGPFWEITEERVRQPFVRSLRSDPNRAWGSDLEVMNAAVGTEVAATGAACLVLDSVMSPRAASMLLTD